MTVTLEELRAEAKRRFGDDPMNWAFVCPRCGDVATGADFREALAAAGSTRPASAALGQECIGRTIGALSRDRGGEKYEGRGCDWAAYGLVRGPVIVTLDNRKTMGAFDFAPEVPA